jgi:predicted amidohydrolase
MAGKIDVLAIPIKTSVPNPSFVNYASANWRALALTRAMENGMVLVVADWPNAKHEYERTVDGRPMPFSHHTCGASSIVDPSQRPNMNRLQQTIDQGQPGFLRATIDLAKLEAFRTYRSSVGLLAEASDEAQD